MFSFDRMLVSFENLPFSYEGECGLPDSEPFMLAMKEVAQLFDHLGTGFGFIRKDIESKVVIVNKHFSGADREQNKSLEDMVRKELKERTARSKNPPSLSRTVLRLMWAIKFLFILMKRIGEAVKPDSHETLRDCVSSAYDKALRQHHPWVVRQAAGAAMLLLPDTTTFLLKLNIDRTRRREYLNRIEASLGPLTEKMYGYYDQYKILDLP